MDHWYDGSDGNDRLDGNMYNLGHWNHRYRHHRFYHGEVLLGLVAIAITSWEGLRHSQAAKSQNNSSFHVSEAKQK